MPQYSLIWGVKFISSLPSQVSLIGFLPVEDVIKLGRVGNVLDEMSVTKVRAAGETCCFKRPYKVNIVKIQLSTTYDWHFSVSSELVPAHCEDWIFQQFKLTIAVLRVFHTETIRIACNHRILTSITAMEHTDKHYVPVFRHSMVTIDLQLVGLIFIVTLDHVPSMVNIFRVSMPYVFYDNIWWVRQPRCFIDISKKVSIQLRVPICPVVLLVVDNYPKSPGK